jgi:hypothetical protein
MELYFRWRVLQSCGPAAIFALPHRGRSLKLADIIPSGAEVFINDRSANST